MPPLLPPRSRSRLSLVCLEGDGDICLFPFRLAEGWRSFRVASPAPHGSRQILITYRRRGPQIVAHKTLFLPLLLLLPPAACVRVQPPHVMKSPRVKEKKKNPNKGKGFVMCLYKLRDTLSLAVLGSCCEMMHVLCREPRVRVRGNSICPVTVAVRPM